MSPKLIKLPRLCSECKSDKTCLRDGKYPRWYRYKDDWLCQKCYNKFISYPVYAKKLRKKGNLIHNPRRLLFKNKRVLLKENPRIGFCLLCSNNIHDGTCSKTNIHHENYHDDDPLKDTIELCTSCHNKIHLNKR